jgi:hypothetical protein
VAFLYPLFFISGVPALLYQVVWQRALFTIYGTNTESASAVVAAFLLGLGLGAFAGGWEASRWPTRLLVIYGVIEFVIGLFGLVSLQIFDWVGLRFTPGSMAQTGIVAFALVVLPTLLMGATLPILVAFLVAQRAHVGASVGILYFVNTLGSAFALCSGGGVPHGSSGAARNGCYRGRPGFCGCGRRHRAWTHAASDRECQLTGELGGSARHRRVLFKKTTCSATRRAYWLSVAFIRNPLVPCYAFLSGGSARDFAHLLAFSPESPLAASPDGHCRGCRG